MLDVAGLTQAGEPNAEVGPCVPPPAANELNALLLRVRAADQRAFRKLYDITAPRLLRKANWILGSRDAAEDTLQDTYVRIWRNAHQFDPALGSASTWIMRVLRNAAIDRLRHDRMIARYQSSSDYLPDIPIPPEPVVDRIDLERSLAQLSPDQRTTIYRVIVQGWTYEEVGMADQVPTPTAKSRGRRGLIGLRTSLGESAGNGQSVGA